MNFTGDEKIKKIEAAIASARSAKQKCNLLIDLAMEFRHAHTRESIQLAEEALAISEEINFTPGKARSHFCLGLSYFNLSEYDKAFISLDRAHHFFIETGDKWGLSNALNNIGLIYLRLGDYSRALQHFSSSLQIKKESTDRFGMANVMISMATIYRETGNTGDALALLTESLKISEELKSDALTGKGLMELGITLEVDNKPEEASEKFYAARDLFKRQNNHSGIARCMLHLGKIKSAAGNPQDAVYFFEGGKRIAMETGDKSLLTVFLCNMAAAESVSGAHHQAIELLQKAEGIAAATQEKPLLAEIAERLSTAYEATGDLKNALAEYQRFISLKEEINSVETATRLRNQQIIAKVEALENENKMLELGKLLAVENVRARISRDIHDEIGSGLTKITLIVQRIKLNLQNHQVPEASSLDKITVLSKEIADHFAEIIWTVNPKHDNLNSLLSYFRNYITRFFEDTSLSCTVEFPDSTVDPAGEHSIVEEIANQPVHPDLKRNLFLVLKEALNNIVKHAQAQQVLIRFRNQRNRFHFEIRDDGMGIKNLSGREFGNGLNNMRQRMESVKGKFEIYTAENSGTAIIMEGDLYY